MSKVGYGFVIGAVIVSVGPAFGQPDSPTIILRIYDNVSLPATTATELRAATESAFAPTGIAFDWRQCAEASVTKHAECATPRARPDVIVRVIQRHEAVGGRHCGFAVSTGAAGFISLSRECASRTAMALRRTREPIATEGEILGYTLAHELAHVLVPGAPHSSDGLFKARLYRRDWKRARRAQLSFLRKDIERLREAAISRYRQATREFDPIRPWVLQCRKSLTPSWSTRIPG